MATPPALVVFRDAFNPFLVKENVRTLAVAFAMDMAVAVVAAIPLYAAHWALGIGCVVAYYVGVNMVQTVWTFPFIWRDAEGAVHIRIGPLGLILALTIMCAWPLQSFSMWLIALLR